MFPDIFSSRWPVIATLHFPALPGAPNYAGNWEAVRREVLDAADGYATGGVDAMMLENFGDAPFFPRSVPPVTVAHFTALACEVRRMTRLPLGINVLRSDGISALAIAQAADAQFIRVNVLCGARLTDQGIIEGQAHELLRERISRNAGALRILADVQVKHSAPIAERALDEEIEETFERGGADAVIITGPSTGRPVDIHSLENAKRAAGSRPVLVGSGATADNVADLSPYCDGFIVGSYFKRSGQVRELVEPDRVQRFIAAVDRLRANA